MPILNINKPTGITSHDVVDKVRKITGERRVGHAGTLDPFAEGVLVVGVGRESTKQLGDISKNSEKEYIATLELGKTSTTGDPEGDIQNTGSKGFVNGIKQNQIVQALKQFKGEIEQVPPAYSAIKIGGEPAYKKARRGEKFILPKRKVRIYEIKLLEWKPPFLKIRVVCSSGTYIRTLAEDIGKVLSTGAYLTKLLRTRVGSFNIAESKTIEELGKKHLV